PTLAELAPGEVGGFSVAGAAVLACRVGDEILAYRDGCPDCTREFAGATLTGTVLRCPHCGSGFDVVHAGMAVGDAAGPHLEPVPVLLRDGVPAMAVAEEVAS
ncbi:Rieske (2Fe-2S) protein, partial [Streptomyces edwardsiae]